MNNLEFPVSSFTLVSQDTSPEDGIPVSLIEDEHPVINFDKVADEHARSYNYKKFESNDALFLEGEEKNPWFIEFKNGELKLKELRQKACASLLIAMHLGIIKDMKDAQARAKYILVYNPDYTCKHRESLTQHALRPSSEPYLQPKVKNFSWLFKSVYSYTPEEFHTYFLAKQYRQK